MLADVGRRRIRHDAAGAVLIWLVALAAPPQGSESPTKAVRGTVTRVISILKDPGQPWAPLCNQLVVSP